MKMLRKILAAVVAVALLTASKCPTSVNVECDKDGCRISGHVHK